MTLNQIIQLFKNIGDNFYFINTTQFGDVPEFVDSTEDAVIYPAFYQVLEDTTTLTNTLERSFKLIVCDLVDSDKANINEVLSDTEQTLNDIIKILRQESPYYTLVNNPQLTPFKDRYGDAVAGWEVTVIIETLYNDGFCDIPSDLFGFDGVTGTNGIPIPPAFDCASLSECETIDVIQQTLISLQNQIDNIPTGGSLAETLALGNTSSGHNIVMSDGDFIKSENGNSIIDLRGYNTNNLLMINNDNSQWTNSSIYMDDDTLELGQYDNNGSLNLYTNNQQLLFNNTANQILLANNNNQDGIEMTPGNIDILASGGTITLKDSAGMPVSTLKVGDGVNEWGNISNNAAIYLYTSPGMIGQSQVYIDTSEAFIGFNDGFNNAALSLDTNAAYLSYSGGLLANSVSVEPNDVVINIGGSPVLTHSINKIKSEVEVDLSQNKIINVGTGSNALDAVNVSQMNTSIATATASVISLIPTNNNQLVNGMNYNRVAVKDFSQSAPVTGTTVNTMLRSILIPGGTFKPGDAIRTWCQAIRSTATGTATQRIYLNTSNTLTGATLLGTQQAAVTNYAMINFILIESASVTKTIASPSVSASGAMSFVLSNSPASFNIDWTQDVWIIQAFQNAANGDSTTSEFMQIASV